MQADEFDSIRGEFVSMLKGQIAKSNNGIDRAKYITFGVPAGTLGEARPRLERVEADVVGNLHRLGVQSRPLDGQERLGVLYSQTHPGSREPFRFSWKDISRTGMGTKDRTPLPPAPGLTSPVSAPSRWGPTTGRCPICKSWLRSSRTSCCGKSWSWTRS